MLKHVYAKIRSRAYAAVLDLGRSNSPVNWATFSLYTFFTLPPYLNEPISSPPFECSSEHKLQRLSPTTGAHGSLFFFPLSFSLAFSTDSIRANYRLPVYKFPPFLSDHGPFRETDTADREINASIMAPVVIRRSWSRARIDVALKSPFATGSTGDCRPQIAKFFVPSESRLNAGYRRAMCDVLNRCMRT